jgi:hypothetical protein
MKKFKDYLSEMALPAKFDEKELNKTNTFKHKINYFMAQARRVGGGSSRVAFVVNHENRPVVIKIAKNKKGLVQNEHEVEMLTDWYVRSLNITIPLIDYDKENSPPFWLMTEYADKAKESDFKKTFNVTLYYLMKCITTHIKGISSQISDKANGCSAINVESDEYNSLFDLMGNVGDDLISHADLAILSNWGEYKGRLVVIDAGASKEIIQRLYFPNQNFNF